MQNCMFVQDAKTFIVALLVTMRQALTERFKGAHRSTISLAAKLGVLVKMNAAGNAPVILYRAYRDLLSQYTMSTNEVDAKRFFLKKAKKLVEDDYLAKGKKIVEDDKFKLEVEVQRVNMMSEHKDVQAFVIPMKLWGRPGTVWLVKAERKLGWFTPHGLEACDTHSWVSRVVREDWKTIGRKIKALSMILSLLSIETGPDSTGLFDVQSDDLIDFKEAMKGLPLDAEGVGGEAFESNIGTRVKLFDRFESMDERLEYLINAPGGTFARTIEAEDQRIRGSSKNDERVSALDQVVNGEQVLSVESLNGECVDTVIKKGKNWKFDGYIQYLVDKFFVAHQSFPEVCAPKTMGKTGFKAGRLFYCEGFGRARLAVKGKDSFLLFQLAEAYVSAKDEVSKELRAQGLFRDRDEFFVLVQKRLALMNQGRAEMFTVGPFKAYAGQTLALHFRKGSDTANLIQRMAAKVPVRATCTCDCEVVA